MSVPEKGSWKTSLTFAMQKFKNNIQRCINVSVRAMGKTTNTMTSKAHYAIFVEGGQLVDGTHAFFFPRPLHEQTKLSDQQPFLYQRSVKA